MRAITATTMPEGIPERTLGWGVLQWCSNFLVVPDGEHKGERWVFKPDQARFILWFYAVDEYGNWIYRRAYRERAKGTGKSPMVAAMACAEFLGPVRFSHFNEKGQPVGKPHPSSRVQLAAVSQDQCINTYTLICDMLQGKAEDTYRLDIRASRILINGLGRSRIIEMVTSSPRSNEGARPTFVVLEETQNWVQAEQGPEMARVLRRNLAKGTGRSVEVTNAPVPGEGSVAELTHEYYREIQEGEAADDGLLFDSFSIHLEDIYDKDQAMEALHEMYKEANWVNIRHIWREILDKATREIDARRFYFNEMVTDASTWISKKTWNAAAKEQKLSKTDLISIGFRGKKTCTAIVATRLRDGAIFLMNLWEAPQGKEREYEVDYLAVDKAMRKILKNYNVYNVFASPQGYQDIIGRWAIDHDEDVVVEEFWSTSNRVKMANAVEQFESAVEDKRLSHSNDPDLSRHVLNCFTQQLQQHGYVLRTETPYSQRYIIAAEAAVISYEAAQCAIEDGALQPGPSGVLTMY